MAVDPRFVEGFLERLQQAVRSQDPLQVAELCTEDVVFDDVGAERAVAGRGALVELLSSIYGVAVDVTADMIDRYISLDGVTAGARWQVSGVLRNPAGHPAHMETAEFYEFRDGLITNWVFMVRDPDWLGRQWGA